MNLCFVELKITDFSNKDAFACQTHDSTFEAKGTNWRENSSFMGTLKSKTQMK